MRHRLLAGLLLSWLLGGCALRAPIEVPVAEPAAREARLAALARWELHDGLTTGGVFGYDLPASDGRLAQLVRASH